MATRTTKIETISEEFPDDGSDERAHDAEIISETRTVTAQKEEIAPDGFALFLENLPDDEDVKLVVTRLADRNLAGQFRLPCGNDEHRDTIYWNGESDPTEIYSQITKRHGGGRYRIQIRAKTGFKKDSWTITLGDPIELTDREKAARAAREAEAESERQTAAPTPIAAQQPTTSAPNQFDLFIDSLQKQATMKNLLFGDELDELKTLRERAAQPPAAAEATTAAPGAQPVTKETIKMMLIEKAIDNPNLLEQALQSVFDIVPRDEDRPTGFFGSIAHSIATNPAIQEKLADTLLTGIELLAAPVANLVMPRKPATGEATPATINLESLRTTRAEPTPAPAAETQPTPAPAPTIAALDLPPVIKLED